MSKPSRIVPSPWSRAAALLLSAALLPAVWYGLLILLLAGLISAQLPDPSVQSGDPCCGYPDTWGEVGYGYGVSIVLGTVLALACWAMAALARWALTKPTPRRLHWRRAAIVGAALTTFCFGLTLVISAVNHTPGSG